MKIDIIIPNYNGSQLIKKNLPKVIDAVAGYTDIGVIIVDDASEKKDQEVLKEFVQRLKKESKVPLRLLLKKRNEGFASTVNKGAFATDADILVLLNSDVTPSKNFLDHPLEILSKNNHVFGVGCLDKSIEGDKVVERGRGIGFWSNGFLQHKAGKLNSEMTLWISGGSCVVRGDLFRAAGGFDPLYNPFYWEDIDLSYRIQKIGYTILFDQQSVVTHAHEEGAIQTQFTKSKIQQIAYRNQLIFHWKNITDTNLLFQHTLWVPVFAVKTLVKGDTAFTIGLIKALLTLPTLISYRFSSKQKNVRSDKVLLSMHKV